MERIAITVIAYNRTESLKRLLCTLSHACYDGDTIPLYISVDKSDTDAVERFADEYRWEHGPKTVVKHPHNMGLKEHVLSQGALLDEYDAVIVLEDDLTVAPDFWSFAKQTVHQYKDDDRVAGVSLYSFAVNYHTLRPFTPQHDGHDVYFMNCAMSWGEIWLKRQWLEFKRWYDSHTEFTYSAALPRSICSWNDKSWLKYHTRYCIENDRYFVFPYVSYTTNYSEAGTHSDDASDIFQVELMRGRIGALRLPATVEEGVRYDGFFENKALYEALGLAEDECCLDLNRSNGNGTHKRFWLTPDRLPYAVYHNFGCMLRPVEQNIFSSCPGNDIFLYDTAELSSGDIRRKGNAAFLHMYFMKNSVTFIREYGIRYVVRDFLKLLKNKLK